MIYILKLTIIYNIIYKYCIFSAVVWFINNWLGGEVANSSSGVTFYYIDRGQRKTAFMSLFEAGRGAAARGVTAKPTGCGSDPHSRR